MDAVHFDVLSRAVTTGCCDGTTCQAGTTTGACGAGGGTCQTCSGTSATCCDGACVDTTAIITEGIP